MKKFLSIFCLSAVLYSCSSNRYDTAGEYYDALHQVLDPAYTDMRYLESSYFRTPEDLYRKQVDSAIDTLRSNQFLLRNFGAHDGDDSFRHAAEKFCDEMITILDEDYRPLAGLFLSGDTAAVNAQADKINARFGTAEENFFAVEKLFVDKHKLSVTYYTR